MRGLENLTNCELKFRISNASTEDLDFSSDEEIESFRRTPPLAPKECIERFQTISSEQISKYTELALSLQAIYSELEEEIPPINIRDELAISANTISLCGISRSNLCRRRSTLIN